MEQITIPNSREIELATMDTVDKFASLAEALSAVNYKDERFLSASIFVMKKISKQTKDVGRIFERLGTVTMSLVSERLTYTNEWTRGRLPGLARPQRQAVNNPVKTFDDAFKLERKTNQLEIVLKEHQRILKKCRTAQQECLTAREKLDQESVTLFIAQKSREYLANTGKFTEKDLAPRDKKIKKLEGKVSDIATNMDNVNQSYAKCAVEEMVVREQLKKLSKELVNGIQYQIKERVTHGIACLHKTIKERMTGECQDKCLRLISGINIKNNVVSSLLRASTRNYVCPDIKEYHKNYGFQTELPDGVVTGASASLNDLIIAQKSTVTAGNDNTTPRPGLLKFKKGMKINQRLVTDDDLAFGSFKSNVFSPKVWGFFSRLQTQAS